MELDRHYLDPRLVDLYDIENPRGADTDFYLALAERLSAHTIVDLGCGTGLLTRELATPSRRVIGADPSPAMLAYARRQPGAERVEWIEGDSSALGAPAADLAVMTGNVAQIFLDDAAWAATLRNLHAALRPGGHLAFESRNPDDRAWERWNRANTYGRLESPHGPVETWIDLIEVVGSRVRFVGHNVFDATGERISTSSKLRFRTRDEIVGSLIEAGFSVEHTYGDWQGQPLSSASRAMVFVARRI